MLVRSIFEH